MNGCVMMMAVKAGDSQDAQVLCTEGAGDHPSPGNVKGEGDQLRSELCDRVWQIQQSHLRPYNSLEELYQNIIPETGSKGKSE